MDKLTKEQFEAEKKKNAAKLLTNEEYDQEIQELTRRLGI